MREDICSIPINEVFEPKDGCPICRLRDQLENRLTEYITGAAMMEPDVRVETNRLGFCLPHLQKMQRGHKRLSVALTLQSHLDEISAAMLENSAKGGKKGVPEQLAQIEHSCFICEKIDYGMNHLFSTLFKLWQDEPEFRALYNAQPYVCYPHYLRLLTAGQKQIKKKNYPDFVKETTALAQNYLTEVTADLKKFCSMHDYRNAGGDWGNSKDAIERTIYFLTSRKVEE